MAQTESRYYVGGGIGVTVRGENLSTGELYKSTLILVQGGINLTPHRRNFPLIIKMEAHAGISNLSTHGARDFELACIVGLETLVPIGSSFWLTASASTGPGYLGADLQQQSGGFIFSNNFSFTVLIKISDSGMYIRPEYRFRHMSSLDITLPNFGVDHHFVVLTMGFKFGGSKGVDK